MKALKMAAGVAGVVFLGLGVLMAATNPSASAYEEYGTEKLTAYVKDNVCQKTVILQDQCASLVDSQQSEIQQVLAASTSRQDFIFFSIYKTDISVNAIVPERVKSFLPATPSYQFETFAVLQSFYTYKYQKKSPQPASTQNQLNFPLSQANAFNLTVFSSFNQRTVKYPLSN
ncbi:DUF4359 domain-containing protein [Ancylothrix sp. C2]|uniref:DUF4359 domain-containing protein n=1 Tax=Ancylothrix sp. D3o TaxID=2953691 RepID=UPI0021BA8DC2|nr:DUF4359 domain-containing protein [Ancylothrix sp. D3o]MCT7948855.1 DUF4359 domain-containing protein [Ancylothrix sp. D3o]